LLILVVLEPGLPPELKLRDPRVLGDPLKKIEGDEG
jgi:hypothetical protein